mgnify:CR=1 FL=1|jgi:hypothetical protein
MSTEQACPWCGSADIIRTIPEKDPFQVMAVCSKCQRVISGDGSQSAHKTTSARRAIEEKTIQLCINAGKLPAIKYYLTEMNKLPGHNIGLKEGKDAVENLIGARGVSSAVKQPSKNGCVIALIILVLIVASIIYFFNHR